MEIVNPVELSFEVTFDASNLFVAMLVYDVTTGTPALVTTLAMTSLVGNTYYVTYTPTVNTSYVVVKGVFTDGTYTTLDPSYAQGSDSFSVVASQASPAVRRNVAIPGFPFPMYDAAGNLITGLTDVVGHRSIDGGAMASCANVVTEISLGYYKIDLAASDLNGKTVAFDFSSASAQSTVWSVITS